MREVAVTDHAVARYQERLRPGLGFRETETELMAVLRFADFADVTPDWARGHGHENVVGWLLLGDGIAFPLVRDEGSLVAVTCLVAGGASEDTLALRRRKRAGRRQARRYAASREPASDRWSARERRRRGAVA